MSRALTDQQQAFLDAMLGGASPSEAYRAAYDCSRSAPRSITANAGKLTRDPRIALALQDHRAQIAEAQRAATERAVDEAGVTRERVVKELAAIAFADIRRLIGWDADGKLTIKASDELDAATAAGIMEVRRDQHGAITFKLHPKIGAVQSLAKILKLEEDPADRPGGFSFVMTLTK